MTNRGVFKKLIRREQKKKQDALNKLNNTLCQTLEEEWEDEWTRGVISCGGSSSHLLKKYMELKQ